MIDELGRYLGNPHNRELVLELIIVHTRLALLPLLLGVVLALPLGWAAHRYRVLRGLLFNLASLLYTVPSLALFVLLPSILGTQILDEANVVIALALYTAALLLRPVAEALDALPAHVLAAATAMGYHPARRFLVVELPLALPVLTAGVRVASVSNISLVSVGALIGVGGLGQLFTEGFQTSYNPPIIVGIVLTLALALIVDLLLVAGRTLATPWLRARPDSDTAAQMPGRTDESAREPA